MARSKHKEAVEATSAIADRMRLERLSLGCTQEEFADMLGVSARQYGRYENKKCPITFKVIFALEEIGMDLGYLLDGVTYRDKFFQRCLETMPDEELFPRLLALRDTYQEYFAADEDEQSEILDKLFPLINEFIAYGKEHYYDEKLRTVPQYREDTKAYEACRDAMIEENTHKHRPPLK